MPTSILILLAGKAGDRTATAVKLSFSPTLHEARRCASSSVTRLLQGVVFGSSNAAVPTHRMGSQQTSARKASARFRGSLSFRIPRLGIAPLTYTLSGILGLLSPTYRRLLPRGAVPCLGASRLWAFWVRPHCCVYGTFWHYCGVLGLGDRVRGG